MTLPNKISRERQAVAPTGLVSGSDYVSKFPRLVRACNRCILVGWQPLCTRLDSLAHCTIAIKDKTAIYGGRPTAATGRMDS